MGTRPFPRALGPILVAFLLFALVPTTLSLGSALSNVSLSAPTQMAGEVEAWTIVFDLPETGNLANYRVVTYFPDGYAIEAGTDCDIEGATETISVNGLDVACTIDSGTFAPGSQLTTRITHVKNPTSEQTTPHFTVKFENPVGVAVGTANNLPEEIYNNHLAGLAADARDARAGEVTDWTVRFGTKNAVGANGDLRFVFPPGFEVQPDASCSIPGASGVTLSIVSATEAVCNLNSATLQAGTTYDATLTKVRNRPWSGSGALFVQTRNVNDRIHDELNATLGIQPHPFTSASLSAADPSPGATTSYTAVFTLFNPWPADGCVSLAFPVGFKLNSGSPSSFSITSGATGALGTVTVDGQKATACRVDGSVSNPGDAINAVLSNVENPNSVDPSDAFNAILATLTATLAQIEFEPELPSGVLCLPPCDGEPPPEGVPSPPRNLTSRIAAGRVWFEWQPPATSGSHAVTNYTVYRGSPGSDYHVVAHLDNVTTHSELQPPVGSTHHYVLTASNSIGESLGSNVVVVSTAGSGPKASPGGAPRVFLPPGGSPTPNPPPSEDGGSFPGSLLSPDTIVRTIRETPPFVWGVTILSGLGVAGGLAGFYEWRIRRLRP